MPMNPADQSPAPQTSSSHDTSSRSSLPSYRFPYNSNQESSERKVYRRISIERLSNPEQLDHLLTVVNPKAWIALLTLMICFILALLWAFLATIPIQVEGNGIVLETESGTQAIYSYFPVEKGQQMTSETPIQIQINSLNLQKYGYIIGKIQNISQHPITKDTIIKRVHSQELANYLADNHQLLVEIMIEPLIDPSTNSYIWTSSQKHTEKMTTGTLVKLKATLLEVRPIDYILEYGDNR